MLPVSKIYLGIYKYREINVLDNTTVRFHGHFVTVLYVPNNTVS